MAKIVIIFDRLLRPDTTGIHCERALIELKHEVHYYPPFILSGKELIFNNYRGMPTDADLYLQIDDDIFYPSPEIDKLKAYWLIDSHRMDQLVGGKTRWEKMKGFNEIFLAQKDAALKLNKSWLPLAFDPSKNYKIEGLSKKFDWCFIGSLEIGNRIEITSALKKIFPSCFIGTAYEEVMNRLYNEAFVVLNISLSNDVNMRLFEAQATASPVFTNRLNNGEEELFENLIFYDNFKELAEKMAFYLKRPEKLKKIGQKQHERVVAFHTYKNRMAELLLRCGINS